MWGLRCPAITLVLCVVFKSFEKLLHLAIHEISQIQLHVPLDLYKYMCGQDKILLHSSKGMQNILMQS